MAVFIILITTYMFFISHNFNITLAYLKDENRTDTEI